LYDILNHERVGAGHQPGFYPLAFDSEGRVLPSGFARQLQEQQQQQQRQLPSWFTASASPSSDGSSPTLQQTAHRTDSFESAASTHRSGGEGSEGMSEQDRQVLLARCRSGPSSVAAAAAASAANQDSQQVLLGRSRSGPAEFSRNDDHHQYYNYGQQQQREDAGGLVFNRSPNRSPVGGRGGGGAELASFESARFGSRPSSSSGVLPALPSLNFEQLTGGGGGAVNEIRRAPWHGADSTYVK